MPVALRSLAACPGLSKGMTVRIEKGSEANVSPAAQVQGGADLPRRAHRLLCSEQLPLSSQHSQDERPLPVKLRNEGFVYKSQSFPAAGPPSKHFVPEKSCVEAACISVSTKAVQ